MAEDYRMTYVRKLQKYLSVIRGIISWSADDFANRLGMTRQTYVRLENGVTQMNISQYIAIRTILDIEIKRNPEIGIIVTQLLKTFIDTKDDLIETNELKDHEIIDSVFVGMDGIVYESNAHSNILGCYMPKWMIELDDIDIKKKVEDE